MWYPVGILNLYFKVISDDILHNDIEISDIQFGVREMATAYRPCPNSLQSDERRTADYNVKAHRCAYLHKQGAFHTALVYHMTTRAIQIPYVHRWLTTHRNVLKICSVGGGPGNDLVGVLSALHHQFGLFHSSATIVDSMSGWEDTFHSVLRELRSGDYGSLGLSMDQGYFDWSFVTADMLGEINRGAREAIQCADLITMIKFVSAAACLDTASMIEKIFKCMKPNALVFFIDNAKGGFRELVMDAAIKCNLNTVFGPLPYEKYEDEAFKITEFGYESCYKTTVTVHILTKPYFACISEARRVAGHLPPSAMGHENTPDFLNVGVNDTLFIRNEHITHLGVNPIQSKKKLKKPKISKKSERESDLLESQKQAAARKKQISSSTLIKPDLESKNNYIENKNNKICTQIYINSNIPIQLSSEGFTNITHNPKSVECSSEKPQKILKTLINNDSISEDWKDSTKRKGILKPPQQTRSLQLNESRGNVENMDKGNLPNAKENANRMPIPYRQLNIHQLDNSIGPNVPESILHKPSLSKPTDSNIPTQQSSAGFTNITHNPKSAQCSGEKPQKILKTLVNNDSAAHAAAKRKGILKPSQQTRSLQFNESGGNAENIDKRKLPNVKEKANRKPMPNGQPNIHQMDNSIGPTVPESILHKQTLSKLKEDLSKTLLKTASSNCTNVPQITISPQSADSATRFIQRNSSSTVNYQNSSPPSDVKSPDDSGCSCCIIS